MDLDQFEDNMVVEWADKYMRYADLLECVGRLTNRPDRTRSAWPCPAPRLLRPLLTSPFSPPPPFPLSPHRALPFLADYGDISIDRMDEAADTLLGQDREAFQRLLREGELVVTAFFIEQEEVLLRRKEGSCYDVVWVVVCRRRTGGFFWGGD